MKALLCSMVLLCALMMALAAPASAAQPTTPRADEYIEVYCQDYPSGENTHLFSRSDVNSLDAQVLAQEKYNAIAQEKFGEECFVAN